MDAEDLAGLFMKDLGAKVEALAFRPANQASFERGFSPGRLDPGLKPKTEFRSSRRPKGRLFHRKHTTFSPCREDLMNNPG